ncbi:MAG TPA: glycosyltransferase family 1 protein [Acetobacteraceae bacterium]|nr:glycosyltransferase family 1 protein [Acetobacteraceae bacterium]
MPNTLWIEVDDLFEYATHARRPSGIQRVAFEIGRALQAEPARVRFTRYGSERAPIEIVPFADVAALFERLSRTPRPPSGSSVLAPALPPTSAPRRALHRALRRAPREIREAVLGFARAERDALLAFRALAAALALPGARRSTRPTAPTATTPAAATPARENAASFPILAAPGAAPGDVFLVLGSPWYRADYAAFIENLRRHHGIRLAVLMHDVMPLQHPEWCARIVIETFRLWFASVLPLADTIFATCAATARDIEAEAARLGVALAAPVRPVPLGTGFGAPPSETKPPETPPPANFPAPNSYALTVSTLEPRKNHALLLRVWQRLLADLPAASVPTLVFAGRIGWMTGDLIQQLVNADWLGGKIRLIEDPTDAEIAALYRGALFTLLPSFAEGWGLPVSESLAFGKPCLAADRPSLREAGGALARYFDPDNLHDAFRVIQRTIADPAGLAAWEEQVRREFYPTPWPATARAILSGLGQNGSAYG